MGETCYWGSLKRIRGDKNLEKHIQAHAQKGGGGRKGEFARRDKSLLQESMTEDLHEGDHIAFLQIDLPSIGYLSLKPSPSSLPLKSGYSGGKSHLRRGGDGSLTLERTSGVMVSKGGGTGDGTIQGL